MQQLALTLSSPLSLMSTPPKIKVLGGSSNTNCSRFASFRSNSLAVNYSSTISVFPAEACETVGGEACLADMCPEVKLKPETKTPKVASSEPIEREYLDYADPKTVLLGEACDVLGGEFCEQPYQMGVFTP